MQSIGEKLEEARKRQGVSIREAAEATKIRPDFLIDFENNRFGQDLPDIYKRGFLKIYARFLRLDAEKMGADFNALQLGYSGGSSRKDRSALGEVEVDGYQSHYPTEESKDDGKLGIDKALYWKVGIVLVLLFVFIAFLAFFVSFLTNNTGSAESPSQQPTNTSRSLQTAPDANSSSPTTNAVEGAPRQITLVATGDTNILVRDAVDRQKVLYRGSLTVGQRVPLEISGRVEIVSTEVQNIQVERANGAVFRSQGTGMSKFFIE